MLVVQKRRLGNLVLLTKKICVFEGGRCGEIMKEVWKIIRKISNFFIFITDIFFLMLYPRYRVSVDALGKLLLGTYEKKRTKKYNKSFTRMKK